MHVVPTGLSAEEVAFRDEVRAWLAEVLEADRPPMLGMYGPHGHRRDFSRALGVQGWIGLTLPVELGGAGLGAVRRFLLTEELLAAQAPVEAHWVADRQSGPTIARFGTPEQQARFLPPIIAGDSSWSIGMSEPDAGSDLAAVKTAAVKVAGGWSVTGTKVWTTLAHKNDWFICLVRTSAGSTRHEGLSQLLVDLRSPGIRISVIPTLDGEQEFCEVQLTDVFVPDDCLLGVEGQGWSQVVGELAYERGGPDRYLSSWGLMESLVEAAPAGCEEVVGRLIARHRIVRLLAMATARALERGEDAVVEAAVTKDLGTLLEQDTIEAVRLWREDVVLHDRSLLAQGVLTGATFTLRGGTTEVLRSMVARSAGAPVPQGDLLAQTVAEILATGTSRDGSFDEALWARLVEAGLPWVGISEEAGGSGGSVRDAATVITAVGAAAAAVPLAETWVGAQQQVMVLGVEGDRLVGRGHSAHRALSGEERGSGPGEVLADRIAATRVLLMAGALRTVLRLVAEHTSTRLQFGQPLIRFQAVGQQVAQLVEHVARAEMAAELATRWLEGTTDDDDLMVATVTVREAATAGAKIAHQVHGAIGIAAEHDLQLFTRRLWAWRDEGGSELSWARRLGARALAQGGDGLWAWTSR